MGVQGKRVYLLGEGPSPFFIGALERSLHVYGFNSHFIERLSIEEVQSPSWHADAALFCIPGGADKEYADTMSGRPFASIQNYIAHGGNYLGICGGAYVAADSFVFDLQHMQDFSKMEKSRDLKIFGGQAIGPDYSLQHVHQAIGITPVRFSDSQKTFGIPYHMGCYFEGVEENGFKAIASYENNRPAVIQGAYGKGSVLLCGPHPELELPAFENLFLHATEKSSERKKVEAILALAASCEKERKAFCNSMLDIAIETRSRIQRPYNQRVASKKRARQPVL